MDTVRAIGLMVASMAAFAVGDALVKLASAFLTPAQGVLLMALFSLALFVGLSIRAGVPLIAPSLWHPAIILRSIVEGLTAVCFFSALAAAPLSLVASIVQAVPLLVTLGAALVLGAKVGPRRWVAIAIGLLGVLIMLRPWSEGLAPGALWAAFAALGLAVRDLAVRFVPENVNTLQMASWGTASLVPAALVLMMITGPHPPLDLPVVGLMVLTAAVTSLGYYLVTAAMRIGDVAAVAPFRYMRLPFALFIAVLFLGERPDALTLVGASIVIGSGLFVLWRERVVTKG